MILDKLKRHNEALIHFDYAIELSPRIPEILSGKGNTLCNLKRYEEALDYFNRALKVNPNFIDAILNKGVVLSHLKRHEDAIAQYDLVISHQPDIAEAWLNRGSSLNQLKRFHEAIICFEAALRLNPQHYETWLNKGISLNELKLHSEAATCYLKAIEFGGEDSYLLGKAHHQMMLICDWSNYEKIVCDLLKQVDRGRKVAEPFGFQAIANSEKLLKRCAEIYSGDKFPVSANLSKSIKYRHKKIRIGYLCGEFRSQATSILMTRVWELHDQSKFEIYAFDNGWDDNSDYRKRIGLAFNAIFDISKLSDLEVANLILSNEIDILVNLNGFFGLERHGVFAYQPAPIQVNYLGFPGTLGCSYIQYIIADRVVIPESSKDHYVEKIVYLPTTYQANDDLRKISDKSFSRTDFGLPENAFVFACFNNSYKITPSIFDSWMRILENIEGSVLWLLADNSEVNNNLKREAILRGVDPARLIFANRLSLSEHLARHDLADLFLDTLPYNAHTTCSDSLWAGLPVLTLCGDTFPGRVSASLLQAVGLKELVTYSLDEYESLAIEIAKSPEKISKIKKLLTMNIFSEPLFNSVVFTKNLESAYFEMVKRHESDLPVEHIYIEGL